MDCNKTIDFFAELKRLCSSRDKCQKLNSDGGCPLYAFCNGIPAISYSVAKVKEAIETMQKWIDEHPEKTYAQDFFEKFPEAKSDKEGMPWICRANCYGGSCQHSAAAGAGSAPCKACWNEEMEAADDE